MKRFTDTNKWKDSWFQDLPSKYKLFWIYLLDECDAAGVWKPNIRLATFQIGEPFEESELKRVFAERLTFTETGYWFITKFVGFQYGELSEACKPHLSVINILKKHKIKGYSKGIHTLEEKEKEKEEDKEEEKPTETTKVFGSTGHFFIVEKKYIHEKLTKVFADGLHDYMEFNRSVLNYPQFKDKFMRRYNGKHFKDFDHMFNSYNKFTDNA